MAFNIWPQQDRNNSLKAIVQDLSNIATYSDPDGVFKKAYQAVQIVGDQVKKPANQSAAKTKRLPQRWDLRTFDYRPACARIWNYFPNPFGVFSYIGENHWAARRALDVIRREIGHNGYDLWWAQDAPKERVQFINKFISDYNLGQLMIEIAIHLKAFGNCWFVVIKNEADGVMSIELLYPDRLYPIYNKLRQRIIGWEYVLRNGNSIVLLDSQVEHISIPSIMGKEIGSPPLSPMVCMIEADLYSDILNNMVQQRGGMLSAIISLNIPRGDDNGGFSEDDEDYVERVQSRIDSMFTGSRAGQTIAAMSNVAGVHKITEIGSIEHNYRDSKDMVGRLVCYQLGVPSEEIGITRPQQYVPTRAEDVTQSGFDREMRDIASRAADAINKNVFEKHLGIYDVRMIPKSRNRSNTVPASQIVLNLSKSGIGATRNELREVLSWTPLPPDDPRGLEIVDTSINRDPESAPAGSAQEPKNVQEFEDGQLVGEENPARQEYEQIIADQQRRDMEEITEDMNSGTKPSADPYEANQNLNQF